MKECLESQIKLAGTEIKCCCGEEILEHEIEKIVANEIFLDRLDKNRKRIVFEGNPD